MDLGDVLAVDLEHLAYFRLVRASASRREVVDLEHQHVAAVAAAALHQAAGGGVRADRRDDLEERVSEREDGVSEPEEADGRVVVGLSQAQLVPEAFTVGSRCDAATTA